ncbi:thioredoxin family protein [Nannocystis sp. ILAH1]|uniref:thioredoxin family protein n=1 Tax=unclassified Nannocystis TaxID=2627009 RepID=UPI0022706C2B|nr:MULTISPECIES: tetratricopeptide repeat protein [unclassified Nannocystis]MCY0988659.1 thioredoxin family protein [Nannocystis sp. ILAH1]MCY1072436.1 thioredoxin family protein [Nannocystis sp. RBIL2]
MARAPAVVGPLFASLSAPLLGVVLAASCGAPGPKADASGPKPGAPATASTPVAANPPTSAGPGVRSDGEIVSAVKWIEGDLEAALAAAKAESKLVFVDVGAYWCPPCRELEEKVFTRDDVGAALAKYVALHVDAEKGEGPELVARYKVQAYPTLLVLDANGVEKGRLVDAMEPPALLAALAKIAAGGDVLAELEQKVAAAPDDLQARYELGVAYALAAKRAQAEAEFERVIAGDPDNAKGLAAKAMSDRAAFLVAKIDGDSERAITLYKELQQKYPAAKESIRAFRAIGRELHKLGRDVEAVDSLKAMVASDQNNDDLKSSFGWFAFRERCGQAAALEAVDLAVAKQPDNAELYYLRAELQHQLGRGAEAVAAIREAARLEPESAFYKRQVRRFTELSGGT